MLKEQINFYTPKVFSVLRFFIRPARVWVIRYSVTAVLPFDFAYDFLEFVINIENVFKLPLYVLDCNDIPECVARCFCVDIQ